MPDYHQWRDKQTDNLCRAFLALEDLEDVYNFLEDLATIGEIKSMAQRLEVAKLLSESKRIPKSSNRPEQAQRQSAALKNVLTMERAAMKKHSIRYTKHN